MAYNHIKPYFRLFMHDTSSPSIFTDSEIGDLLVLYARRIDREQLRRNADGTVWQSKSFFLDSSYSLFDDYTEGAGTISCSTPSTINLIQGEFEFTADPDADVYLDGVSYNLKRACADACLVLMTDPNRAQSWSRGGLSENPYNLHMIRREFLSDNDESMVHEIKRTYQK